MAVGAVAEMSVPAWERGASSFGRAGELCMLGGGAAGRRESEREVDRAARELPTFAKMSSQPSCA